jgi:hypothetical protein
MHFPALLALGLAAFATAAPSSPRSVDSVDNVVEKRTPMAAPHGLHTRDKFDDCALFGPNCAVDGTQFCDADTGKISVCHKVPFSNGRCWVRYTQNACGEEKREAEAEAEVIEREALEVEKREVMEFEKRDRFELCESFGAGCETDGNTFCYEGRTSVCHRVPFSNGRCWVRFTAQGC